MTTYTSAQIFVKHPQYVEESTPGTTPSSPSFTSCGIPKSMSLKIDGQFVDVSQLATEDLIAIIQGMQSYECQIVFAMSDSTFLKYGINAANFASPTGTISKSLTIGFSVYLNGTQNYIFCTGARAKSCTLKAEMGKEIEATIDFVCMGISTPVSTSDGGLTSPTWASLPSGVPFDWITGGAGNVTWNGSAIDARSFTINLNRNTTPEYVLGNINPVATLPHGRRIAGDIDVLWSATTLETDFKAGTARTLAIVLKSATSTLTVTGSKIVTYNKDVDSNDSEAIVEKIGFKGLSVTVT